MVLHEDARRRRLAVAPVVPRRRRAAHPRLPRRAQAHDHASSSSARTPRSPKNRAALRAIAAAGHEIGNHSFRHEPWLHLYTDGGTRRGAAPGRGRDRGGDRRAAARLPRPGIQPVAKARSRRCCAPRLRLRRDRVPEPAEPARARLPLLDQQADRRGEGAAQRAVRHLEGRACGRCGRSSGG